MEAAPPFNIPLARPLPVIPPGLSSGIIAASTQEANRLGVNSILASAGPVHLEKHCSVPQFPCLKDGDSDSVLLEQAVWL